MGAAVLLLALLWVATAGALVMSGRGHLEDAERALAEVRASAGEADLATTSAALSTVTTATEAATRDLEHITVRPLGAVPVLGADLRAVSAIARAGRDLSRGLERVVHAVTVLPEGLDSLGPKDGRLPVDALEALGGPLRDVATTVTTAYGEIAAAPASGHVDTVATARERAIGLLTPLRGWAGAAAGLVDVLPSFLGSDGPRTYLFGASTPAELRGTGGYIGSTSLLTIDDGRLEFGPFTATSDLPVLPPDRLPPPSHDDAERWERYGGTGSWQRLHRTPHFPAAAAAMERLWEETRGGAVDGMIVVDPFALAVLMELTEPLDDVGGRRLDPGTVVTYLTNEAYSEFTDPDERKTVLGDLAVRTFAGLLGGADHERPSPQLLTAVSQLVGGGHLLVHSRDGATQAALDRVGATGALSDPEGDLVSVVVNSGSGSKVDFYADRTVQHSVTLLEGGRSRNELTVELTNGAPTSGLPTYVIGPNNPTLDAGDSLSDVSIYTSPGARFTRLPTSEDGLPSFLGTELGYTVHDGWVRIASGESVTRQYTWTTPDAWQIDDAGHVRHELLFLGQTVIRPTQVDLTVRVPPGMQPVELPAGADFVDDAISWSGRIRGEDVRLATEFRQDVEPGVPGS